MDVTLGKLHVIAEARGRLSKVSAPRQNLPKGDWPRHRHDCAYVAMITDGGYFESGDKGRWMLEAGDLVFHEAFEAHANIVSKSRSRVLNIPLPHAMKLPPVFRIADPDGLIRAVQECEPDLAPLFHGYKARQPLMLDWQDYLADELRERPCSIGNWAHSMGLSPATVSRGFRAAFGTAPVRYRHEARTRSALNKILASSAAMADIAIDCGFADQAHMSRAIVALTGATPGSWRQVKFVQDAVGEAH